MNQKKEITLKKQRKKSILDRKIGRSDVRKIGGSEDRKFVNRPYMVVYCSYQKLYNVCQVCIIRPSL
jgi:hypothetical protein